MKRQRVPRCLPFGDGIGHSFNSTSVSTPPVEITTRVGEIRVSEALA